MMEKAIEFLEKTAGVSPSAACISQLGFPPHKAHVEPSFFEYFVLRGIRVDHFQPGFISCSFKVPPRLTDANGCLRMGAIVSLVDEIGAAVIHENGSPMEVSVDMSISHVSAANVNDELEITGRVLGQKGGFFGTCVLIQNKATGEVIAEGRHSLFRKPASKL